jgi:hypothetical protein
VTTVFVRARGDDTVMSSHFILDTDKQLINFLRTHSFHIDYLLVTVENDKNML